MTNFTIKVATLKANIEAAKAALEEAQRNFDDAENAYRAFIRDVSYRLCKDWRDVQETLGEKKITGCCQYGGQKEIGSETDIYIDGYEFGFIFTDARNKAIARYVTPEQVLTVIDMFKAAVARGENEFRFPPVAELNRTESLRKEIS